MWKGFWIFVGTVIIAIVLALVVWSYARADYIIESLATWEEVKVIHINKTKKSVVRIKLVLKNPIPCGTVYAIVEINQYCIPNYILIGKDIRKFFINEPAYKEVKLKKEAKEKIWTFLRMQCGIQLI